MTDYREQEPMIKISALSEVYRQRPLLMTGLSMLLIGLPLSLFLTSLSQFFLAGSFFLEGPWKKKFIRFFSNKTALLVVGLWLLHIIGLAWTSDLHEGIHDIRIKLPLVVLPVILSGCDPLERHQFRYLVGLFIAAVIAGTLIYSSVLFGLIPGTITDVRQIFIFKISHIRFALFVCMAITGCVWFFKETVGAGFKLLVLLVALWLTTFLIITASGTGMVILFILILTGAGFYLLRDRRSWMKVAVITILSAGVFFILRMIGDEVTRERILHDYPDAGNIYTAIGNRYYSDSSNYEYENGYRVWSYIEENEISQNWNRRSKIPIDSLDNKGQLIRGTLVRFLSSKGWKKDSVSVWSLSGDELAAIENGIANIEYMHASPFSLRLKETIWEFTHYRLQGDANRHSLTQRLEFWKAASSIIREHPIFGVGTGDMPEAFQQAYRKLNTTLEPEFRLRSHNQLLALMVAFGLTGGVLFLFVVLALLQHPNAKGDLLFIGFWMIFVLSTITEDTLETQPGATFFGLFVALLLFGRPSNQRAVSTSR